MEVEVNIGLLKVNNVQKRINRKMETLIKFVLVSLIIIGGLVVMTHFWPLYVGKCAFTFANYTISYGLIAGLVLFYLGIKAIN